MGKLFLTIAFILAGSSVVAASFVSAYIPPFTTTFMSLLFGSLTAMVYCGKKMIHAAKRLSQKTWITIALQALFGSFLFRVCLTFGLQHIGAAEAGIVTGATPAITALFTWIMLREQLTFRTIIGIVITFAGIVLVQGFPFAITIKNLQIIGVLFVLASAACESLFTTLSRRIHKSTQETEMLSPIVHAGFVSIFAMILCFIPAFIESPWKALQMLPLSGWLALVWYGSAVTIIAFACMFAGAKRCNGYTIAAFAGIIPISSSFFSVILLKESLNLYQIAGCILVVAATLIISKREKSFA
jgi:drug/metabolite transporter (DMT)-like permease